MNQLELEANARDQGGENVHEQVTIRLGVYF